MPTEKRNMRAIRKQFCSQYKTDVTLSIEAQSPSIWQLVAQYENGGFEGKPEFAAEIPDSWTVQDVMQFIDMPGSKACPVWEMAARTHASAALMWPI